MRQHVHLGERATGRTILVAKFGVKAGVDVDELVTRAVERASGRGCGPTGRVGGGVEKLDAGGCVLAAHRGQLGCPERIERGRRAHNPALDVGVRIRPGLALLKRLTRFGLLRLSRARKSREVNADELRNDE